MFFQDELDLSWWLFYVSHILESTASGRLVQTSQLAMLGQTKRSGQEERIKEEPIPDIGVTLLNETAGRERA